MAGSETVDIDTTVRLVAFAQAGDREAVEQLFRRFAPRVARIAALRFGWTMDEFEDYEDIAQDALLKAFKGLGGFDPRKQGSSLGAFRNWLSCCVETAIKDHFRRKGALKRPSGPRLADLGSEALSTTIFAGREPSPSGFAMGREMEERIERALMGLKKRYRDVIILRQLCDMPYEEIARELGFASEGSVRLVLHRALRKLEEALVRPGAADGEAKEDS
jgi:RNA polymerase sigma factor (sigma-70 family)